MTMPCNGNYWCSGEEYANGKCQCETNKEKRMKPSVVLEIVAALGCAALAIMVAVILANAFGLLS